MAKTETFQNLDEVRAAKIRLRAERDRVQEGFAAQLQLIREPEFRKAIAGDAMGDLLQAWKPLRTVKAMFGGTAGITSKAIGLVVGAKAKTPAGRVMVALASFVLPALMEKFGKKSGITTDKLQHELGVSWERVKEYVKERREAREAAHNE